MTAARGSRSSCGTGTAPARFVPQALLGAVSAPAAAQPFPAPLGQSTARAQRRVCDHQPRTIPGEHRAPQHLSPAPGGSGGAPTQEVHPPRSPKEVTKPSLTKPAQLLAQCSTPAALHPAQSLCCFHPGHLQRCPYRKSTIRGWGKFTVPALCATTALALCSASRACCS